MVSRGWARKLGAFGNAPFPIPPGRRRRSTRKPAKQPTRQKSSNSSADTSRNSTRLLLPALNATRSDAARRAAENARSNSATTSDSFVASVVTASALPPAFAIVPTTFAIFARASGDIDVISFGGEPAADGAAGALLGPNAHDNRCWLVHLVSPFGHTNRTSYPTIIPLSSTRARSSKRGEAEDFATPSAQDRLPTIEARRDSSIQLPSGSRIIDIRATLPSVTGARPSRTPLLRRSLWTVSISATCRVM
jgi:hypothetical protein